MRDIYAKCGCNCGHCLAYKDNSRLKENRERCSKGWEKYLGARLNSDRIRCEGCQAKEPWKSGNLLPDPSCNIRPCAVKTGVKNCAYCSGFPCEELELRLPDKSFREFIEDKLGAPIPEQDYHAFIKPYEGISNLKDMRAKLNPKKIKSKYEVKPITAKIADFPEQLSVPKNELKAIIQLYNLFVDILTARADFYTRQVLLKRRRPHILGMLWVIGLYGKLEGKKSPSLVLESATHGSKKEYSWLVRKRDNTFYGAARQAARLLKDFGINVEFVQLKKAWKLKMSFTKKAGGTAALKALKKFTTKLANKYGEPTYAGNTRFKGRAFALFSKADMSVLAKKG